MLVINIVLRFSEPVSVVFEISTGLFGIGLRFTYKPNVSAAPLATIFSGIRVYPTREDVYKRQGFADHCLQHNNFIDTKNITLLHNIQKGKKMDLLEILELKKQ